MKIFISWSGEISKNIAEKLKKWLPCLIPTSEVFYSSDDIEKGERWNSRIAAELEETNYGIICLTKENVNAPWINFEAGALAKKVEDSRVSVLLLDIKPSEVKGPLSSFQGTSLSEKDFFKLIKDINNKCEKKIEEQVIETLFENMWDKINEDLSLVIEKKEIKENKKEGKIDNQSDILQELVQLINNQNVLLNNPNIFLPQEYIEKSLSGYINKASIEGIMFKIIALFECKNYNVIARLIFLRDFYDWISMNKLNLSANDENKLEELMQQTRKEYETKSNMRKKKNSTVRD